MSPYHIHNNPFINPEYKIIAKKNDNTLETWRNTAKEAVVYGMKLEAQGFDVELKKESMI